MSREPNSGAKAALMVGAAFLRLAAENARKAAVFRDAGAERMAAGDLPGALRELSRGARLADKLKNAIIDGTRLDTIRKMDAEWFTSVEPIVSRELALDIVEALDTDPDSPEARVVRELMIVHQASHCSAPEKCTLHMAREILDERARLAERGEPQTVH